MTSQEKYILLKNAYSFKFQNIALNKIMSMEFCFLSFWPNLFNEISILSMIKKCIYTLDLSQIVNAIEKNDLLVSYMYKRQDYLELINASIEGLNNTKTVSISDLPYTINLNFSISDFVSSFIYCFYKFNPGVISPKARFYLTSQTIFHLSIIRGLNRHLKDKVLQTKKYLPFNSSFDQEVVFVEYFKLRGVKTFHLSHGVSYVNYLGEVPGDFVNGENLTADNILVWGESSKDDLVRNFNVKSERIHIAGNPKYPFREIKIKHSFSSGIVFLARSIYDDDNIKLIKTLGLFVQNTGVKLALKPHPKSNILKLKGFADTFGLALLSPEQTITELLSSGGYDFSICYNTTAYYESMYYGVLPFRYGVNENECYLGQNDRFFNELDLLEKINEVKNIELTTLNRDVQNLLIKVLGMGINNYKKLLSNE